MFIRHGQERTGSRRGFVVVFVAVCMVALFSVIALAVDGGMLMTERRHAYATADAAAMAAAADLYDNFWTYSGKDPTGTAKASALKTAAGNGYLENGPRTTVTVNIPPKSGRYTGLDGYAEVLVEYRQPRAFSVFMGSGDLPVPARAVALGMPVAADVGILVLDPDDKGALNSHGSGLSSVKDTPVVVNSNHPDAAAIASGGGNLASPDFYITGGYDTTGGGQFIGDIHTGVPPMEDPLAYLPPPDPNEMTVQSTRKVQYTQGTADLLPGVYKGGISVSGVGSLNLAPGIYYMDGGGFSFSGQGNLFGEGVMIYSNPGNGNSGGISVTGQGSMVISAPTSGPYQGITFWQDRTSTVTGEVSGTGGKTDITGTFYFAGALLKISGNGGVANIGSQYISNLLDLGGNGGINIQWNPYTVARKRSIYLVE